MLSRTGSFKSSRSTSRFRTDSKSFNSHLIRESLFLAEVEPSDHLGSTVTSRWAHLSIPTTSPRLVVLEGTRTGGSRHTYRPHSSPNGTPRRYSCRLAGNPRTRAFRFKMLRSAARINPQSPRGIANEPSNGPRLCRPHLHYQTQINGLGPEDSPLKGLLLLDKPGA